MEDFIPEGKEEIGAKSLFVDFIPAPTKEQIENAEKARIARNTPKKKEKVVLTEQQIADFKAMEEETAKEREINGEAPIEPTESAEPTMELPKEKPVKNKRAGKRR